MIGEEAPLPEASFSPEVIKAEQVIKLYPYDYGHWKIILSSIDSLKLSSDVDVKRMRDIYERFLSRFPTSGRYWKAYASTEIKLKNFEAVESIFTRSLLRVTSLDLWRCYISYIRDVKSANITEDITRAYDFALLNIGKDPFSNDIWLEYISYLRSWYARKADDIDAEKMIVMTSLRKVFQRAVVTPLSQLDDMWREWEAFEKKNDKNLAKGLLDEYNGRHIAAKAVFKERCGYWESIDASFITGSPGGSNGIDLSAQNNQLDLWRKLIAFEKSDPERLGPQALAERVRFTYKQCINCFYYFPEVWLEWASYEASCAKELSQAVMTFKEAAVALPNSLMLHFAHAEYLESQKQYSEVKELFECILNSENEDDGTNNSNNPNNKSNNNRRRPLTSEENSLVYIQYMRFARRSEKDSKFARSVFLQARKAKPPPTYHVYIATALMEYHCNNEPNNCRRIFDSGLDLFVEEAEYISAFVDFLEAINDSSNLQVLLERVIEKLLKLNSSTTAAGGAPIVKVEPSVLDKRRRVLRLIWDRFLRHEYDYGDLRTFVGLEARRSASIIAPFSTATDDTDDPEDDITELSPYAKWAVGAGRPCALVERYRYRDLLPIEEMDLKVLTRNVAVAPSPLYRRHIDVVMTSSDGFVTNKKSSLLDAPNYVGQLRSRVGGTVASKSGNSLSSKSGNISKVSVCRPDLESMDIYRRNAKGDLESRVDGQPVGNTLTGIAAEMDLPEVIASLIRSLPPSNLYHGPRFDENAIIYPLLHDLARFRPDMPMDDGGHMDDNSSKRRRDDRDSDRDSRGGGVDLFRRRRL